MRQAKQPKIPLNPPLRKGVDAGQFFASVGDCLWFPYMRREIMNELARWFFLFDLMIQFIE